MQTEVQSVPAVAPHPERIRVVVSCLSHEAQQVLTVELRPAVGEMLPLFEPGDHIDVHLPYGISRQYSLCGGVQHKGRYLIGVRLADESRGGSAYVHRSLKEGDALFIGRPRSAFRLQKAPHYVLFAGGIGITPLLSMAERLAQEGRPFALHYSCRDTSHAPFLSRLQTPELRAKVTMHFDSTERQGRVNVADVLAGLPAQAHLYTCGPMPYMDHIFDVAQRMGWSQDRLHRESFAAPAATFGATPFDIELRRTGKRVHVRSEQTAADAMLAAGVDLPLSCEQGVCGTCLTTVIEGVPDHRDTYLTEQERQSNSCFTPCCSRSKTALLVLDL